LRPVFIIILVVLALVVVALLFLSNPSTDVDTTLPNNDVSDPTDPTDSDLEDTPEPKVPEVVDPNTYCENDFSCFIDNLVECKEDVFYTQEEAINYPNNGTIYNFSIDYEIKGFDASSYCVLDVTLNDHKFVYSEAQKQSLSSSYTEEDIEDLEDLRNSYINHLISQSGSCKLDASYFSLEDNSITFLQKFMMDVDNCQGNLFEIPTDPSLQRFFIHVN